MPSLANHQKRSTPAPAFSLHNLAKAAIMTRLATSRLRFSSQGISGPSISFRIMGRRSLARFAISARVSDIEGLLAAVGVGDGVGVLWADAGALRQTAIMTACAAARHVCLRARILMISSLKVG